MLTKSHTSLDKLSAALQAVIAADSVASRAEIASQEVA
jgi:hypothetical protein